MKMVSLTYVALIIGAVQPIVAIPFSSTNTENEYIVVFKSGETRPWAEILSELGYNETKRHTKVSAHEGGHTFGSTYVTSHGSKSNIRTFGSTFRALTMKMPRTHSADIRALPGVAFVERNNIRSKQVPHKSKFQSSRHGITEQTPREVSDWKNRHYKLVGRQDSIDSMDEFISTNETTISIPTSPSSTNGTISISLNNTQLMEQATAPWNLQRISSADPIPADGRLITELTYKYRFDKLSGAGADVYVVDSGLDIHHPEFQGRAQMLFSAFDDDGRDVDGHGTHVAGTVGSLTYGVAKNANLYGCKVLSDEGDGSDDGIAAGIDAALTSHLLRMKQPDFAGSVMNLSLGSPKKSRVLFDVIQRAAQAGMHITIAPGNDNKDACTDFPAGYTKDIPSLLSVGASDIDDFRASFSDYGSCVDIHAPGVGIVSTVPDGKKVPKEGTSMASPAVAGVIAAELIRNPQFKLDPVGMKKHIIDLAKKGAVKAKKGDTVPEGGRDLLNTGFPGNPT
ncbi:hypothetical protein H072_4265 [Dactylellina haptotyla CBS 200.50]|uniref:Peptidase S8/S53 domain-containing protein n=1 Tax=Dactylellina haptotyla (strain CBS 200.50) TaxID=1284197 RepID=S8C2C2_DACHA|nr:hypothetical protein H072_4265 [Dactylellina haptotyla CBS 200.50]